MNHLSKELSNVLNSANNDFVKIGCKHYEERFYAIVKLLRESILLGDKNLVIIEKSEINLIDEILDHSDIKDFVVTINNGNIEEKDWYRIKSIAKKKKIDNTDPSIKILKYKYAKLRDKLQAYCSSTKEKLFGDKTYSDLSKLASKSIKLFSPDYIKFRVDNRLFDFNEQEFWMLKKNVEEACLLYRTNFLSLNQASIISDNGFKMINDKEDIHHVISTLNEFKDKTDILLNEYYEFRSTYYSQESKKVKDNLISILEMAEIMLEKIQIDEISKSIEVGKSNHFGFRKSKRNLQHFFDEYDSLIEACGKSNCIDPNLLSKFKLSFGEIKELERVLIDLINCLKQQLNYTDEVVASKYRRINSRNSNSEIPEMLNVKIDLLFKSLNDIGFWNEIVENNTLSIQQELIQLERIRLKLLSTINFLEENFEFVFWKSIIHQMDEKSKIVVNALALVSKSDWMNAMVSWYLVEILRINSETTIFNDGLFNDYLDVSSELYTKDLNSFREQLNNEQVVHYNLLKKNNKSYYNSNFKKIKPGNSNYNYHLGENMKFIQSVFPICILAIDNIELIPSKLLNAWDKVHICSNNAPNVLSSNRSFFHYVICDQEFKGESLIQYNYRPIGDFNTMTTRQQLEPAKELARRLINVNPNHLNLMVVDKKYIISLVSELELNQYIEQSEHNIVKAYNTSGNLIDNITDMILASEDDYELIVLVEDVVVKFDNVKSLEWQYELLNDYRKAGFDVVSVKEMSIEVKEMPLFNTDIIVPEEIVIEDKHVVE